jgi:uroporphyrin-III C-methyltransferase/precorrin-2 dehydrogenase/sirohydrochlorin ferrochelatase
VDYFPAFLNLKGKPCLLVGAGSVAARKATLLLAAGAELTVVAPQVGASISDLAARGRVKIVVREFDSTDLDGHWLVVAATNDTLVQQAVFAAASAAGVFCNSVDDLNNSSYITPAIVDRSPLVVAVSSGGAAPVLARKIRSRIEEILPARIGRLAQLAHKWRDRVRQRLSTLLARRRYWEQVFDGRVASAVYAGRIDAAETLMADLLHDSDNAGSQGGEAWLVGAGPGDPGLLTLRALQIMQTADVILYDRLVSAQVLDLARRDADRISVGKTPGCRANSQEEINELLVGLVASGKRVCRLKGGDPFIFGRGGEEVEALVAAGLPYEIVPGITAAAGCAAYAGIPLTHRDVSQSVVLLTAHGKDSVDKLDWPSLARDRQTLAMYMAVHQFPTVMRELTRHGRSVNTPIAIIERGTTDQQRVTRGTLGQLNILAKANKVEAPAILIVGEVAAFGEQGAWFGQERSAHDSRQPQFGLGAQKSAIY